MAPARAEQDRRIRPAGPERRRGGRETQAPDAELEPTGRAEPEPPETAAETCRAALDDTENPEERSEPGPEGAAEQEPAGTEAVPEQFGTIEDAGSPTHNQPEGAGSKDTPEEGHGG